jgi:hypothetical protein
MSVDRFLAVGGFFYSGINLPPAVPWFSPREVLWGVNKKPPEESKISLEASSA